MATVKTSYRSADGQLSAASKKKQLCYQVSSLLTWPDTANNSNPRVLGRWFQEACFSPEGWHRQEKQNEYIFWEKRTVGMETLAQCQVKNEYLEWYLSTWLAGCLSNIYLFRWHEYGRCHACNPVAGSVSLSDGAMACSSGQWESNIWYQMSTLFFIAILSLETTFHGPISTLSFLLTCFYFHKNQDAKTGQTSILHSAL